MTTVLVVGHIEGGCERKPLTAASLASLGRRSSIVPLLSLVNLGNQAREEILSSSTARKCRWPGFIEILAMVARGGGGGGGSGSNSSCIFSDRVCGAPLIGATSRANR